VVLVLIFVGSVTIWAVRNVKTDVPATTATSTDTSLDSFTQTINLTLIDALKSYHDSNKGTYPNSLHDLVPKYLPGIPNDDDGEPFTYAVTETGRGYQLCSVNKDGQQQCLGKDSPGNTTGL